MKKQIENFSIYIVIPLLILLIILPSTMWWIISKIVILIFVLVLLFYKNKSINNLFRFIAKEKHSEKPAASEEIPKEETENSSNSSIEDDFNYYIDQFIASFKKVLNGKTCSIFLYHKGKKVFKLKTHLTDYPELFLADKEISDEMGLFHIVLKNNTAIIENELSLEPRFLPYYKESVEENNKNGSAAFFPFKYRGEIVGVITIDTEITGMFGAKELQLAREMVAQFEIQFRSSNQLFELQSESQRNKSFIEISNIFNNNLYFEEIWEESQSLFEKYLSWDRISIILTNNHNPTDNDFAYIHTIWGVTGGLQDGFEFQLNDGIVTWCIINKKPFNINDMFKRKSAAYRFIPAENNQLQIRSMLIIPIITDDSTFGAIMLESQEPYLYSHQDKVMVQFLARQIGFSLERTIQQEKLTNLIQKDVELGIWNYQSFVDRMSVEIARCIRFDSEFSAILFKINLSSKELMQNMQDNYPVIKEILENMQKMSRSFDWFGRLDQFHIAVMLFETSTKGAAVFAQKVINKMKNRLNPEDVNQAKYSVNASISTYPSLSGDLETMIQDLKTGINKSVNSGENQIYVLSSEEATSL